MKRIEMEVARVRKGLSQYELGKLVGLNMRNVSVIENGGSPLWGNLLKICKVLDITPHQFGEGVELKEGRVI